MGLCEDIEASTAAAAAVWDGLCEWLDRTLFFPEPDGGMQVEQNCDGLVRQLMQDQDSCAAFYNYFLQRVQEETGGTRHTDDIKTFLEFCRNVRAFCRMLQPSYDEIEVNSILVTIIYKTEKLRSSMKSQAESHFRESITKFTTSGPLLTPTKPDATADNSDFIADFQDPLGLITLCEPILKDILIETFDTFIHTELCKAPSLAEHHNAFTNAKTLLESNILPWIDSAIPPASGISGIQDLNARLRRYAGAHLYELFTGVWIPLSYSLTVAYPATEDVLRDLRTCLEHLPHLYTDFRVSLLSAINSHLLTVGAATSTIILAFIKLVKAVKLVDPTGIILASVSAPIRDYLRGRKDAVQCVVDAFVHKTSSEIEDAFRQKPAAAQAVGPSMDWTPDPVSPDPTFSLARMTAQTTTSTAASDSARNISETHTSDIIELLEEIWGGPEAFTDKYIIALADSLLSKPDHTTEVAQVELLKQRFGDYLMQGCEVMLRDVEAHKPQPSTPAPRDRGTQGYLPVLKQRTSKSKMFSADVLSHLYWPESMLDKDAQIVNHFPESVRREMARYAETNPERFLCKKIEWTGDLGYVDLDIRVPGSRELRKFSVPPTYATVVLEFSKRATATVGEISEALEISQETARRSLGFWTKNNVLYPCGSDTYKILCDNSCPPPEGSERMTPDKSASASMSSMSVSFLAGRGLNSSSTNRTSNDNDDEDNETEISVLIQGLVMSSPEGLTLEEICSRVRDELGENNITNSIVSANLEFLIISSAIVRDGDKYKINMN